MIRTARVLLMLLHIVADYGYGDLAFAEALQRIRLHLSEVEAVFTSVPPFSTLAAGFCIAQLGLNDAPQGTVIYHNVAPRLDTSAARIDNAGERLTLARLPTGTRVVGVAAGYTLSFIRSAANELRWVKVTATGSQFRSRDLFPQMLGKIIQAETDVLGEEILSTDVPDIPSRCIAYIDGYGNLKTTIPWSRLLVSYGTRVRVRIGQSEHEAVVSDASFAVARGELALAPGSSGWTTAEGTKLRWMEIFLRGSSAAALFGGPPIGEQVRIYTPDNVSVLAENDIEV